MLIFMFYSIFSHIFACQIGETHNFGAKLLQKMHIRKKTSTFFEKKIDFIYQLRYYLYARWEFTHKRVYR